MVYEVVTTRFKLRLFFLGFLLGVAPIAGYLIYHVIHSGYFISQNPPAKLNRAPASFGEPVIALPRPEIVPDSRWILVQDNYKKLVNKNEQLNGLLLYHPNCALGITRAVTSGRFSTDQMIKIYSDLYLSYQKRVTQLHTLGNCHQVMALFDAGASVDTKTAVAFEQVKEQESRVASTP